MAYKVIGMLKSGGLGKDLNDSLGVDYNKQLAKRGDYVVAYMSEAERSKYTISVVQKKVCDKNNTPLNTAGPGGGFYIFVMTDEGVIYSARKGEVHHHSSFLSGRPAAAAGCWVVDNGKVTMINNHSGHYCPCKDFLEQFTTELKNRGVDLTGVQMAFGKDSATIAMLLKQQPGATTKVIDYLPGTEKSPKPVKVGEHFAGQFLRLYTPQPPRWEWY